MRARCCRDRKLQSKECGCRQKANIFLRWPCPGPENSRADRPRLGLAQKVKISRDVHFFRVVAGKRFGEIENKIRFALGQRGQTLRSAIQNLIRRLMAKFSRASKISSRSSFSRLAFFRDFSYARGFGSGGGSGAAPSSSHTS